MGKKEEKISPETAINAPTAPAETISEPMTGAEETNEGISSEDMK